MAHLQEVEIIRLAEGHLDEVERERFLRHLADCEHCLKVYSYTLAFIEEEKHGKFAMKFPVLKKIFKYPFTNSMKVLFKRKVYLPAFAALALILVMLPFVIRMFMDDEITTAKLNYIEESIMKMGNLKPHGFLPSNDTFYAAIQAGFFTEDLNFVLLSKNKNELGTTICRMLTDELKIISRNKPGSAFPEQDEIKRDKFKKTVDRIRDGMEAASLAELYQFGRFVENSLLSTFERKLPRKKEIEKYQKSIQSFDIPMGVFNKLEELKTTKKMEEIRNLWESIKEIIFN